ncbi:NlpC/P60 family protein [Mycolicibacterium sp. XJ870]
MNLHRNTVKRIAFTATGILLGVAGITTGMLRDHAGGGPGEVPAQGPVAAPMIHKAAAFSGDVQYQRLANPPRTVVTDRAGRVVAMLTDGARTANVVGPTRRFAEPSTTSASVTTQSWVRILPHAWMHGAEQEPWFRPWLDTALHDRSPDVLAAASQYLPGSPEHVDAQGHRYCGDARYGKLDVNVDGRVERSDFYDYLGLPWTFPDGGVGLPDPARSGAVDDSGFVRLVFGYRSAMPLRAAGSDDGAAGGIPRGTGDIAAESPGTVVVPDRGLPVSDFGLLQPGDLVFFNTDPDRRVDHVGIYLGVDDGDHHRFISSRRSADGPTMGDTGGAAVLDGGGDYAAAFRSVKRL